MLLSHFSDTSHFRTFKMLVGGTALFGIHINKMIRHLIPKKLASVSHVNLQHFQGVWYEIARKPVQIEQTSFHDIHFEYTTQNIDQLNMKICYRTDQGRLGHFNADVCIDNAPENSQFSIEYLPSIFRKLKKGHQWILRLDPDYKVVLIGHPNRKFLWLLSRTPKLDASIVDDYMYYAIEQGFKLNDIILSKHHKSLI